MTAKLLRGPFQCAVKPWDAKRKKTTESSCNSTTTPYYKVLLLRTPMELRHSGLVVVTHETSSPLREATYGMQNATELRHSCLVAVIHETASPMRGAPHWDAKCVIYLLPISSAKCVGRAQTKIDIHLFLMVGGVEPPHFVDPICIEITCST